MVDDRYAPYAVFLLRIALGVMFLSHSLVLKVMMFGLPGTADYFASLGLPGWFAYVVVSMEIVGGIALILGIQARWVALLLSPILLGAIWVHAGNGWVFTSQGGGWEYPVYLTLLCVAQAMLGDGAFALNRSRMPGATVSRRAVSGAR